MKKVATFLLVLVLLPTSFGCSSKTYLNKNTVVFNVLDFYVMLMGRYKNDAYNEMLETLETINKEINLSISDSTINKFNKAKSGEEFSISSHMYNMLSLSIDYYKDTNGLFDISVNQYSQIWNVDIAGINKYSEKDFFTPLPTDFTLPSLSEIAEASKYCNMVDENDNFKYEVYESVGGYILKKKDDFLKIDLGAISKGYCADICAQIAKDYELDSALINLSGNIVFYKDFYNHELKSFTDWQLGVNSPRPKKQDGASFLCAMEAMGGQTVVTSGDYQRYFDYNSLDGVYKDLPLTHIIDPRNGMPMSVYYDEVDAMYKEKEQVICSATIITDVSSKADAYATAVCLMTLGEALEFLQANSLKAVVVTSDNFMINVGNIEFIFPDKYNGFKNYQEFAKSESKI